MKQSKTEQLETLRPFLKDYYKPLRVGHSVTVISNRKVIMTEMKTYPSKNTLRKINQKISKSLKHMENSIDKSS